MNCRNFGKPFNKIISIGKFWRMECEFELCLLVINMFQVAFSKVHYQFLLCPPKPVHSLVLYCLRSPPQNSRCFSQNTRSLFWAHLSHTSHHQGLASPQGSLKCLWKNGCYEKNHAWVFIVFAPFHSILFLWTLKSPLVCHAFSHICLLLLLTVFPAWTPAVSLLPLLTLLGSLSHYPHQRSPNIFCEGTNHRHEGTSTHSWKIELKAKLTVVQKCVKSMCAFLIICIPLIFF